MFWLQQLSRPNIVVIALLSWIANIAPAEDSIPKVLILGDFVYQQPAREVAKELKGRAEVVYGAIEVGTVLNSHTAIQEIDRLLAEQSWQLIHFNVGLGDLVYRAPKMKSFRVMPPGVGGVRATSPQQYAENLDTLVQRLKASGARLVWASTTPIRHSSTGVFDMESEIQYNAIAAKIMAAHHIQTNDMYTFVKGLIDMDRPASHGADPFFFDRKPLHPPIVKVICDELGLPQNAKPEQ